MFPHLTILAAICQAIAFASVAVIVLDEFISQPKMMAIMRIVWPVTALYAGPLAVVAYWKLGRAGHHDMHQQKEGGGQQHQHASWSSVLKSTSHCGAGCTLGDILGESLVFLLGLKIAGEALYAEFVVDLVVAYLFGIVFQYFSIVPMKHLSPGKGIVEAIKADTLSLLAFQVGMYGFMALNRFVLTGGALHPNMPAYWLMMQIAMLVGFGTSMPANYFLVRSGIKEAM